MTFPTLASDFYGFEALLADHERDALVRLRTFLESEVKPVVNDYWERAEFPRQILPGLHDQQVFGNLWEETKAGDYSAVYGGWTASPPMWACRTASRWARSASPAHPSSAPSGCRS